VRRAVWAALAVTIGASAWVVLTPEATGPGASVVSARVLDPSGTASAKPAVDRPLPARWEAPLLPSAARNPFGAVIRAEAPKPAPVAAPPKLMAVQTPPPVATAPAPSLPTFSYRYLGRMVDPLGQRVLYLAKGDSAVVVQQGTQLSEGYVVDTVSESTIEIVNTATQQRHLIAIPPDATATASTRSAP
jgi:hypothetical protein